MSNLFARLAQLGSLFDKTSPIKFFVLAASVFGVLFLLITPPFQAPDEPVHFFRAYQVSQLNLVVDKHGDLAGGYLPKAVGDTIAQTATHPIIKFLPNKKYDIYKTFDAFSIKTNQNDKKFYDFSPTAGYPPVSYAPQAAGILVGRALGAPPILLMYLGRLANLIVWIGMFALAIKWIPYKKWAVVFIGLLPMALFQAASLSSDVMVTGLLALLFASILRFHNQRRILSNKQIALLLVLASGMALTKQIMFVLLPLVLLLPTRLFKSRKAAFAIKSGLIIIPLILFAGWMLSVRSINVTAVVPNGQDTAQQRSFIAHNPHSYINVLWNTNFFNWSDSITDSLIGNFGWQDTPLADWIVILGYLSMAFIYLTNYANPPPWLSKNKKWFLIIIGFIYWLAVSTALYVYYSPVGYKIIIGLQGRYFLPLAILAIPVLYSNWLKTTKSAYRRVAISAPAFLLVASVITIYVRYYVNNV